MYKYTDNTQSNFLDFNQPIIMAQLSRQKFDIFIMN